MWGSTTLVTTFWVVLGEPLIEACHYHDIVGNMVQRVPAAPSEDLHAIQD